MKQPTRALRLAARRAETDEPGTSTLLPKPRNRRVDLRSLPGVLRESAHIYKDLIANRISLETAEVRSRAIARHHEILKAVRQDGQVTELIAEMKELRPTAHLRWDPDETE